MLPSTWRPQPPRNPVRLGAPHDGGYVLPAEAVDQAAGLLGLGLGLEWSFEAAFRARSSAPIVVCDHTINRRFWIEQAWAQARLGRTDIWRRRRDYRRFFGADPATTHLAVRAGDGIRRPPEEWDRSLAELLAMTQGPQLLRIDIEGDEYRVLEDLVAHEDRLVAVVIEWHDLDLHRDRVTDLLGRLRRLTPCWVHGNNYGGLDAGGDPLVLEMTLAPAEMLLPAGADATAEAEARRRVADLTHPNRPDLPDVALRYAAH